MNSFTAIQETEVNRPVRWVWMGVFAATLLFSLCFKFGLLDDDDPFPIWLLFSSIFGLNASGISLTLARGQRMAVAAVATLMVVTGCAVLGTLYRQDLFAPLALAFAIHALFCWLIAFSVGLPRWTVGSDGVCRMRSVSIVGLMAFTTSLACLFALYKFAASQQFELIEIALLVGASTGGWLLGCGVHSFCHPKMRWLCVLALPIFCAVYWAFSQIDEDLIGDGETIHLTVTMPVTGFVIAVIIGAFSLSQNGSGILDERLVNVDSDRRSIGESEQTRNSDDV